MSLDPSTAKKAAKSRDTASIKVEWLRARDLTEKDIGPLVDMGVDIHRESIYRDLDYNPSKLRKLAEAALDRNSSMFCCFVIEHKGSIAGVLAGIMANHCFGSDISASDLFLYTRKEYRATRIGASVSTLLLTRFESWAKRKGAAEITIQAINKGRTRRTHNLLQGLGYGEKGAMLKKDVDQDA